MQTLKLPHISDDPFFFNDISEIKDVLDKANIKIGKNFRSSQNTEEWEGLEIIGENITIGDNVTIVGNVLLEGFWGESGFDTSIQIGDNVTIGGGVLHSRNYHYVTKIMFGSKVGDNVVIEKYAHIREYSKIEDDCKIGADATISVATVSKGVEVGKKCFVSEGMVLKKDLPDHSRF